MWRLMNPAEMGTEERQAGAAPRRALAVDAAEGCLVLHWRRLQGGLRALPQGSETLFSALYGYREDTFWLDRCAAVAAWLCIRSLI